MTFDIRNYDGSVFYRSTNDADLLYIMADMIADLNPDFTHYRPDLAIVVTWEIVQPDAIVFSTVRQSKFLSNVLLTFLKNKTTQNQYAFKKLISVFLGENF